MQGKLAELRRRIARIDRKYAAKITAAPAPPITFPPPRPHQYFPEEWLHGESIEDEYGRHFETERLWERHRRHGSIGISDLQDLPPDSLAAIADAAIPNAPPHKWAFLDTETAGLAGGAGSCAFLVGVGRIDSEGFRLRHFFMRDFSEESSVLHALAQYLAQFDVLVTYNGKTYDQPLLENRYAALGMVPPFCRLAHFDLLAGARRLWKLRFGGCRLVQLENRILGVEREGDLPGELIPYVYFEYLRTREAFRLLPIFHHNAIDILSLACLTAVASRAYRDDTSLASGAEMAGVARWLLRSGRRERALRLLYGAVDCGLRDDLLFRALWDIAALEKKLGNKDRAIAVLQDLALSPNAYQFAAQDKLAKFTRSASKKRAGHRSGR